jgi:hypothetical protein
LSIIGPGRHFALPSAAIAGSLIRYQAIFLIFDSPIGNIGAATEVIKITHNVILVFIQFLFRSTNY